MRKHTQRFFLTGILAIIILAVRPLVGLAFGDTSTTQPASYSFISIDIPNASGQLGFTHLADINDGGEITGGFTNSSGFGFLLDKFRSTDIQCPGPANALPAQPQSINKQGAITGFCFTSRVSGFFRNKKGKVTILDFPRANLTEAIGINDDGQVVGDYRDTGGKFHGFFWDDGPFLTIDVPFPEATSTAPNGINNVGQIVGFYQDGNDQPHGFFYDNGIFTSFDFPGALATLPADINDHGQIVGNYADTNLIGHGFLLENGRFTTFDVTFSNVVATQVSGINNRGQIVGRYLESNPGDPVNPFLSDGFIATPGRESKSKSTLLVSKPNDFSNLKPWTQDIKELSRWLAKSARPLY